MDSLSSRSKLLDRVYSRANRVMQYLLMLLLLVCLCMAWIHGFWSAALIIGVPATLLPVLLIRWQPTQLVTRLAVAVGLMLHAALEIHLLLGMIEGHFAIFVLLSALLAYRDWRPLVAAAATISIHHILFCYLQSQGLDVYVMPHSHMHAYVSMVLIHAAYVVAQTVILTILAIQMRRDAISREELARLSAHIGRREGVFDLNLDDAPMQSSVGNHFKHTMQAVRSTLIRVGSTLHEELTVADALRQGNDELASRNRHQTEALERTQHKLQALTQSANDNSERAGNAAALATESGGVAETGEALAVALAEAMKELEQGSRHIAEITGLIDSIAFQTNILALNASVEASRAGESGRGFAVVASEVQALAAKSASASQDIRKQTELSHRQILDGTSKASEVALNMGDIVNRARSLATLIDQISRSSGEQTGNLKAVNDDIGSIGEDTQQNSSLAERVSRASEQLQNQSRSLQETLATFQLGEDDSPTPAVHALPRKGA